MSDVEARLARLEAELALLRDRQEICQLTAAYGPAVDSADSAAAARLWTADGGYDWGAGMTADSPRSATGRAALMAMVDGPEHRGVIAAGAAHWLGFPHVTVDGDTAVSVGYSCLFVRAEDGYRAARVSACHFEWARSPEGWKIVKRSNRLLDGSAPARDLLAAGLAGRSFSEA